MLRRNPTTLILVHLRLYLIRHFCIFRVCNYLAQYVRVTEQTQLGAEHWEGEKGLYVGGWVCPVGDCRTREQSVEKSLSWKGTEVKSRHCAASSYHLPVGHEGGDN